MIRVKPSNRHGSMKKILSPVLIVCHVFGITLYYWRNKKLWRYLYKLFFCCVMLASAGNEIASIKYWEEHADGLHGFLVKLDVYSWWFCYYANFCITTLRTDRITAVIDGLDNSNVVLPSRTQVVLFRFNVLNLTINMGLVVLFNVLGHNIVWPNENYTFYTSIIYILGDLMILMCFYEFIQVINLIGEIFKQINYNFKNIRQSIKQTECKPNIFKFHAGEIVRLRESHLFLTKTCVEVNACFSEQLLLILYFSMVEAIYATRSILGDFSISEIHESILNIFCDCLWLLPYIATVIQMVVFCEKTFNESRRTLKILHNLMNIYYYDCEALRELELFALQVHQNSIHFNIRLFDLHYPLLNTLLSTMITYFVVIATFQGESNNGVLVNWNFKTTVTPETTETTTFAD